MIIIFIWLCQHFSLQTWCKQQSNTDHLCNLIEKKTKKGRKDRYIKLDVNKYILIYCTFWTSIALRITNWMGIFISSLQTSFQTIIQLAMPTLFLTNMLLLNMLNIISNATCISFIIIDMHTIVSLHIVSRIYGSYTRSHTLLRKQCLVFMLFLAASEHAEKNPLEVIFLKRYYRVRTDLLFLSQNQFYFEMKRFATAIWRNAQVGSELVINN